MTRRIDSEQETKSVAVLQGYASYGFFGNEDTIPAELESQDRALSRHHTGIAVVLALQKHTQRQLRELRRMVRASDSPLGQVIHQWASKHNIASRWIEFPLGVASDDWAHSEDRDEPFEIGAPWMLLLPIPNDDQPSIVVKINLGNPALTKRGRAWAAVVEDLKRIFDDSWAEMVAAHQARGFVRPGPPARNLLRNAEWFVRYQVLRQSRRKIAADPQAGETEGIDRATVRHTIRDLADLIGLPLRTS